MKLIVGTDSTWSIRAIICGLLARLEFDVEVIDLSEGDYKRKVVERSPTGLVPALDVGDVVIYDSLAIAEFFNESSRFTLFPKKPSERALARSLCAELHSGFFALRKVCPFKQEKCAPLLNRNSEVSEEINRIGLIFDQAQLPFMFGKPGVVDAFYAVMAYRLDAYGICFEGKSKKYQQNLIEWPILSRAVNLVSLNTNMPTE